MTNITKRHKVLSGCLLVTCPFPTDVMWLLCFFYLLLPILIYIVWAKLCDIRNSRYPQLYWSSRYLLFNQQLQTLLSSSGLSNKLQFAFVKDVLQNNSLYNGVALQRWMETQVARTKSMQRNFSLDQKIKLLIKSRNQVFSILCNFVVIFSNFLKDRKMWHWWRLIIINIQK